jgi:hypothetical protein
LANDRPTQSVTDRPAEDVVSAKLYADLFTRFEAAVLQAGQMTVKSEMLAIAEKSLSTLENENEQLRVEVQRLTNKRKWFGFKRQNKT